MAEKKKITKVELVEALQENLGIANAILRDPGALADKPQVLIKYMEYRHKAMTMLYEMGNESASTSALSDEVERLRRRIKELEHKLSTYKDKYGDVLGEGAVDAGSLHDSKPVRAGRDPA